MNTHTAPLGTRFGVNWTDKPVATTGAIEDFTAYVLADNNFYGFNAPHVVPDNKSVLGTAYRISHDIRNI